MYTLNLIYYPELTNRISLSMIFLILRFEWTMHVLQVLHNWRVYNIMCVLRLIMHFVQLFSSMDIYLNFIFIIHFFSCGAYLSMRQNVYGKRNKSFQCHDEYILLFLLLLLLLRLLSLKTLWLLCKTFFFPNSDFPRQQHFLFRMEFTQSICVHNLWNCF